jgi:hypothetical protein
MRGLAEPVVSVGDLSVTLEEIMAESTAEPVPVPIEALDPRRHPSAPLLLRGVSHWPNPGCPYPFWKCLS